VGIGDHLQIESAHSGKPVLLPQFFGLADGAWARAHFLQDAGHEFAGADEADDPARCLIGDDGEILQAVLAEDGGGHERGVARENRDGVAGHELSDGCFRREIFGLSLEQIGESDDAFES